MRSNRGDADLEQKLSAWASAERAPAISAKLQDKLRSALTPALMPVKPIPSQRMLVLMFLAVFVPCATVLVAFLSKIGLALMTRTQVVSMTAILAAAGTLFSWLLAWEMVPGSRRVFSPSLTLAATGIGVVALIALLFSWRVSAHFVSDGWPCAALELIIAIPGAALFWLVARRGALFASSGLGATIAGIAAALALIPLQSQCMLQQAPHLLVWHVGTAALLIGLGAFLGRKSWAMVLASRSGR